MSKASKRVNGLVFRQGTSIGTGNAETDDEFLFDCFVDHGAIDEFLRPQSPAMVIAGRTGAGKTAIIRYIQRIKDNALEVDPSEMSMSYVSNSDALRFLSAIGADLDLLFQVLWKHVICLEFIRMRWDVDNDSKSVGVFQRLFDRFGRDARKSRALTYLQKWEGRFWIAMDENIKEITESFEQKLHDEFGAEIAKFKAGGQYDKRLSAGQKSEIVARFRKIVSAEQLQELSGVIDMLASEAATDSMKIYYIMIDKLDEHWVDVSIRFKLIRALLESLKSFRKVANLKILVALRADVRERVMQETSDPTFQREKFDDFALTLRWNKVQMRDLVERRIDHLFKRQYTQGVVTFSDIFPERVGSMDCFEWMLERTLMRPRDLIAFVNEALHTAEGSREVSVTQLRKAEVAYAKKRRDALLQEWFSAFPSLKRVLDIFTIDRSGSRLFKDFTPEAIDDFALGVVADARNSSEALFQVCNAYVNGKGGSKLQVLAEAAAVAYRVGAVGVKLHGESVMYSHLNDAVIAPELMDNDTGVRLHPMLQGAYRLQEAAH